MTCEGTGVTGYGDNYNELSNYLAVDLARRALLRTEQSLNNNGKVFLNFQPEQKRLPGLRRYDGEQLFALVALQRHCSLTNEDYSRLKVFYENIIPEQSRFSHLLANSGVLQASLGCKRSQIKRDCGDDSY